MHVLSRSNPRRPRKAAPSVRGGTTTRPSSACGPTLPITPSEPNCERRRCTICGDLIALPAHTGRCTRWGHLSAAERASRQIRYYRFQWTTSLSLTNCFTPPRGSGSRSGWSPLRRPQSWVEASVSYGGELRVDRPARAITLVAIRGPEPHGQVMDPGRRRLLQGGVAAGALFLPAPYAWVWAQSEGALKLLRAPKLALVIGN